MEGSEREDDLCPFVMGKKRWSLKMFFRRNLYNASAGLDWVNLWTGPAQNQTYGTGRTLVFSTGARMPVGGKAGAELWAETGEAGRTRAGRTGEARRVTAPEPAAVITLVKERQSETENEGVLTHRKILKRERRERKRYEKTRILFIIL